MPLTPIDKILALNPVEPPTRKTTPMSYAQKHSLRDSSLDSCGIGHDVQEKLNDGAFKIAQAAASLSAFCHNQLNQDLLTNAPCGIECSTADTSVNEHAITQGLASFVGMFSQWDIAKARRIAALILEEVSDHEEAALMFSKAKAAHEEAELAAEKAKGSFDE